MTGQSIAVITSTGDSEPFAGQRRHARFIFLTARGARFAFGTSLASIRAVLEVITLSCHRALAGAAYSHHWEAIFYGHTRTMKSMISTSVGLCQEAVTKPFNASAYLTTNQIPAKLTLAATALNVAVPAAR
jgi:hypothetical protein